MGKAFMYGFGGGGGGGLPEFTYTGAYLLLDDGGRNWRIKFLTSGTFTPLENYTVDVFLVGGGGNGANGDYSGGGGGGGGYTQTFLGDVAQKNVAYEVTVGGAGGYSQFGNDQRKANAGINGSITGYGGEGGSGGGNAAVGGSDGSDGGGTSGGDGQGSTTREFAEENGDLYAGGGGGIWGYAGGAGGGGRGAVGANQSGGKGGNGTANTGGGGGGSYKNTAGTGGSGIVIIRNHRSE